MRKIKGYITVATMMAVLAMGTTFANAGIIVAGLRDDAPVCKTKTSKTWAGIIVAGIVDFSRFAVTGIIVAGAPETDGGCTVDRNGIIVAG